jgi:hypothetical protein
MEISMLNGREEELKPGLLMSLHNTLVPVEKEGDSITTPITESPEWQHR